MKTKQQNEEEKHLYNYSRGTSIGAQSACTLSTITYIYIFFLIILQQTNTKGIPRMIYCKWKGQKPTYTLFF